MSRSRDYPSDDPGETRLTRETADIVPFACHNGVGLDGLNGTRRMSRITSDLLLCLSFFARPVLEAAF